MIVAVFAVKVPAPMGDFNSIDRATATVERYLYGPLQILGTEVVGDLMAPREPGEAGKLRVVVAGAFRNQSEAERRVQAQRDRFASGLYPTTEPTFTSLED